ncbi:DUF4393 domain-containing protein [Adhaeribacter soli]|uniref:DUF4393 domain-containing protein n=1 Tax=Adhaeribacter soli TaxID=2607655 RepID=A0A5N1IIG6_9BACT|nr:DUF4393 domain-containing protein [Adhaeribacter soli]KAA9325208.1 DUF4393 domain-containing protein [Adhaeribacter soli]
MIDPTEKVIDEASKLVPEVYKDLAKPATVVVGEVAGRSVKALLAPVRGLLWGWEKIEELVTEGVNKRFEKIPEERRQTPEPEIAVPLMQALSYTAQNETLREMYLNLLANSMDKSMNREVHPSFVELIKQMNSLDAKVFDRLAQIRGFQLAIHPTISIKNKGKILVDVTPEWFVGWVIPGHDIFEVSTSLIRLSKFGLIELMYDSTLKNQTSDSLRSHKELITILSKCQVENSDLELEIEATDCVLHVNEFGKQFQKACK